MTTILLFAAAQALTFTADRIAVDNVTKAAVATGHVVAVSAPTTLRGDYMVRDANGKMTFYDPTCVTTCSNDVGHTHWNVSGEVEYQQEDHVLLRNAWLTFYELPVFWFPYLYYPLNWDCGFSWMPGYQSRWGAYLLTKYAYHLLGDVAHQDNTWWLRGDTRLDLRYQNGVAVGEDLFWNLGDFGAGSFMAYYAWDQRAADEYDSGQSYAGAYNYQNWGSTVDENRYILSLEHAWQATERDYVFLRGSYLSDSYVNTDFNRTTFLNLKSRWLSYRNSGVFWEHIENMFSLGAEASGRLNDFYAMTERLPEVYLDVSPQPLFGSFVNYETENRFGFLRRKAARYGNGIMSNPYAYSPGLWANYDALRLDSYHRLTTPFRCCDDLISAVPRVGYRGTGWTDAGVENTTGFGGAGASGGAFRSIGEIGSTFSARGTADVNTEWQHMIEPYLDVLAQEAWYSGIGTKDRPYVFDNLDASMTWEDQFAGRSRNLPYSYYGITPGVRNAWSALEDGQSKRSVVDFDVYAAMQFNTTTHTQGNSSHRLAEVGKPNYGENACTVVPGARLRWAPSTDTQLAARGEYDTESSRLAVGSVRWSHLLSDSFKYNASYSIYDQRYWDFSSSPDTTSFSRYGEKFVSDERDIFKAHIIQVGCEHQIFSWLAWGPTLRWDMRENEIDTVGVWIDYLTDCLGFRLLVDYDNEFTMADGYTREEEWSFGFYVYLRAFGSESGSVFMGQ